MRKHLNADSVLAMVGKDFQQIFDLRAGNAKISLDDALMSALAMFHLKDPSLLAFDKRRREKPENLHVMHGITNIPCDSQIRAILDQVALSSLISHRAGMYPRSKCSDRWLSGTSKGRNLFVGSAYVRQGLANVKS